LFTLLKTLSFVFICFIIYTYYSFNLIFINEIVGLAFDEWDIENYTNMFLKSNRNPTTVECFDLAQSNSEHSRHWFFKVGI